MEEASLAGKIMISISSRHSNRQLVSEELDSVAGDARS